jgi:hypothetical protein
VLKNQFAQMMVNEQEVKSIQKVIVQQQLPLLPLIYIYWMLLVRANYFSMDFVFVVDQVFVVAVELDFVLKMDEFRLYYQ